MYGNTAEKQLPNLPALHETLRDCSRYICRCRVAAGFISLTEADEARALFGDLNIRLYSHELFVHGIWELRANLSAYDARYVALAEATEFDRLTTDSQLANAPGNHAHITLIS